jgi:TonB family protein
LSSLAELADAVSSPKGAIATPETEVEATPAFAPLSRPDLPILASPWFQPEKSRKLLWRYLAGAGAALVLALFLFASWRMMRELKSRNGEQSVVVQPPVTTPANTESLATVPSKPTPEQIASTHPAAKNAPKNRGVVPAADTETETDDGLIRNIPVDPPVAPKAQNAANSSKALETENAAPPQVSMVSTGGDPLHSILATTASLPKLEHEHSQGATPVVLDRKVMPSYPREALTLRHEGVVVVRATVAENGKVAQVKLLSGDFILGKAAMDAIRLWHYHPAMLNGVPSQAETDITLNFKLP